MDPDKDNKTEVVEISDELKKSLVESMLEVVEQKIAPLTALIEKMEPVRKTKEVGETPQPGDEPKPGDDEDAEAKKYSEKGMGRQLFAKQLLALTKGEDAELAKLNKIALGTQVKAGYGNTANTSEGGALVAPAEFLADVARNDGTYGVALRDARVRTISGNSLQLVRKSAGLQLVETGQGAKKPATKMAFALDTVTLRKFTGIAPYTEELDEDGAISIYDELVTDFSLARNQKADELVFTDATSGLINIAGTKSVSGGTNLSDIDFDDLSIAINKIPRSARVGAKFYISDSLEAVLRTVKVSTTYAWGPASDTNGGTIWGYPYEVVEVLPTDNNAKEAYAVFGNLQNVTLIVKKGLELKLLTEATVTGTDGAEINLAEQDMVALRAVTRMAAVVQFPGKFVQIGTGTVS
jgi:HK97 family phage major capsid protein